MVAASSGHRLALWLALAWLFGWPCHLHLERVVILAWSAIVPGLAVKGKRNLFARHPWGQV
jgi:hypothetical protein